jgi:hypothetical protein
MKRKVNYVLYQVGFDMRIQPLFAGLLVMGILTSFDHGSALFAQEAMPAAAANFAAQYQLGNKDEILMNVNVWGYVRKPGQYVVPRHTDLISLISFAGGPIEGASLNSVKIIRAGQQFLASNDSREVAPQLSSFRAPILEVQVDKHMRAGEVGKIPILEAGDTVMIPQSTGNKVKKFIGFGSVFAVVGAVASVVLIADRIGK